MAAAKLGKAYIEVAQIADAMGWRTERTRRWLLREGAVFKKGRYWYTTRQLLMASFPEVYEDLVLGRSM